MKKLIEQRAERERDENGDFELGDTQNLNLEKPCVGFFFL